VHFWLVKNFDYDVDCSIAYALSKYHTIIKSQRKLNQIIETNEYLGRTMHEKTFRYHLKKMLEAGYILKNELEERHWKRGKRLPLDLSPKILEQINLGNLIIQYDNHDRLHSSSYSKLKKQSKREE
jgi:hypothetical protein